MRKVAYFGKLMAVFLKATVSKVMLLAE